MTWLDTSRAKPISWVTTSMVIPSAARLAHDVQHLAGQLGVQSGGGLVKIDDLGAGGKGAGNGHPLLLPARQLVRVLAAPVGHAHLFQHLDGDLLGLGLVHFAGHDQPFGHVLQHGLVAEQVVALEHKGRLAAQPGDVGVGDMGQVHLFPVKDEAAAVRLFQKVDAAQQGGLARAGGAQDGHHRPFFRRSGPHP